MAGSNQQRLGYSNPKRRASMPRPKIDARELSGGGGESAVKNFLNFLETGKFIFEAGQNSPKSFSNMSLS